MFGLSKVMTGAVIVLVVICVLTIGWAVLERSGRHTAQAKLETAHVDLRICQLSAQHQNAAIRTLRQIATESQRRAALAKEKAEEHAEAARKAHEAYQALINMPSSDLSCDSAWKSIEDIK